ncbi:MAG: hypothetical protein R3F11_11085 [Verrucomicrobiales bacterium]
MTHFSRLLAAALAALSLSSCATMRAKRNPHFALPMGEGEPSAQGWAAPSDLPAEKSHRLGEHVMVWADRVEERRANEHAAVLRLAAEGNVFIRSSDPDFPFTARCGSADFDYRQREIALRGWPVLARDRSKIVALDESTSISITPDAEIHIVGPHSVATRPGEDSFPKIAPAAQKIAPAAQ